MGEINKKLFSVYKRQDSPYFYAQYWDDSTEKYSAGRSTGETDRRLAEKKCEKWLRDFGGLPPITQKNGKTPEDKVLSALKNYLLEKGKIIESQSSSIDELFSQTLSMFNGTDIDQNNPIFVDFLLKFWDWDTSLYIKDKLESGQRIGETYCNSNKRYIEIYAVPFFEERRIRNITTHIMEVFKSQLPRKTNEGKGLKPRSINSIIGCIGTALEEAKRLGIIKDNPCSSMRKLAQSEVIRNNLSRNEIIKLFSIDWPDKRSKLANQLSACSGLRAGEIGALRIQDIDIEKGIIFVRGSWERHLRKIKSTKNGKDRELHTPEPILKKLIDLHKENPYGNDFIFWSNDKKDEPMYLDLLRNHLEDALVKIGISIEEQKQRNITFHAWRHYHNSVLRGNIPDPTLRGAMGQVTPSMTDYYYWVTPEQGEDYRRSVEENIIPFVFPNQESA